MTPPSSADLSVNICLNVAGRPRAGSWFAFLMRHHTTEDRFRFGEACFQYAQSTVRLSTHGKQRGRPVVPLPLEESFRKELHGALDEHFSRKTSWFFKEEAPNLENQKNYYQSKPPKDLNKTYLAIMLNKIIQKSFPMTFPGRPWGGGPSPCVGCKNRSRFRVGGGNFEVFFSRFFFLILNLA